MKTSVIEVHVMLSTLSPNEVEKRIGEVPGVESATVNYAAGNATVRYDETRLDVADIKAAVHQRGHQPADKSLSKHVSEHEPAGQRAVVPTPQAAPASSTAVPTPVAAAPAPAPAVGSQEAHAAPGAEPSTPVAAVPGASPVPPAAAPAAPAPAAPPVHAPATATAPAAPAAPGDEGRAAPGGQAAMPANAAFEMGHGDKDLPAMVRDIRNRFWICLIFTVPIFVYAPMGSFFKPPAPPFGLKLNLWLFFFASAAILYPSWPFFVSAWRALKTRTLSMAVLIVLSVGTGYLFSVGTTFFFKAGGQFF